MEIEESDGTGYLIDRFYVEESIEFNKLVGFSPKSNWQRYQIDEHQYIFLTD